MPYYTQLGQIPRREKRHTQFRRPDGATLFRRGSFGTEGFSGPTATMYHIQPPTQVSGWKTLYSTKAEYVETDTMRMRHLKTAPMKPHGDPVTGRVVLFGNSDCEMAVCNPAAADASCYHYKNGQGDECIFIHFGTGVCYTLMGTLKFGPHDYVVIPKGVTYQMVFDKRTTPKEGEPSLEAMPFGKFLLIETCNGSHIGPPPRLRRQGHQPVSRAPLPTASATFASPNSP